MCVVFGKDGAGIFLILFILQIHFPLFSFCVFGLHVIELQLSFVLRETVADDMILKTPSAVFNLLFIPPRRPLPDWAFVCMYVCM